MARDLLAIPVSTVASESAFSTSGRLISPHRSRLHPTTLEALMCARTWLWNEINGMQFFHCYLISYSILTSIIIFFLGLTSTIDNVSCPTLIDEEEEPEISFMPNVD